MIVIVPIWHLQSVYNLLKWLANVKIVEYLLSVTKMAHPVHKKTGLKKLTFLINMVAGAMVDNYGVNVVTFRSAFASSLLKAALMI